MRMENNMPPTEDCVKEWKTIQNLESQKKDYYERNRRVYREKEEPLGEFVSRKRPEKRNDQFVDRLTGLPIPYGKHSEFYPNKSNPKRHFKHMKPLAKISEDLIDTGKDKFIEI